MIKKDRFCSLNLKFEFVLNILFQYLSFHFHFNIILILFDGSIMNCMIWNVIAYKNMLLFFKDSTRFIELDFIKGLQFRKIDFHKYIFLSLSGSDIELFSKSFDVSFTDWYFKYIWCKNFKNTRIYASKCWIKVSSQRITTTFE